LGIGEDFQEGHTIENKLFPSPHNDSEKEKKEKLSRHNGDPLSDHCQAAGMIGKYAAIKHRLSTLQVCRPIVLQWP
jgi:hypothetical protein